MSRDDPEPARISGDVPRDGIDEGKRLIRAGGDKGLSLTERLTEGLHRLTWRTPLHDLRLKGRHPLKLVAVPDDPVPGDAARGRDEIMALGCAACHRIPGIPGPSGLVGPDLAGFSDRVYIGGVLANTPANLRAWLRNPRAIDAKTAMPDLGLDDATARDIAAYLYART